MRNDPRLQRFKDEEKQAKIAKKQEKEDAIRRAAEEKKRAEEEERLRKEEQEKQEKLKAGEEKKEREARKNKARKDRKAVRDHAKANDYYFPEGTDKLAILEEAVRLDDLLESMEAEQLESYRARQTDDSQSKEQLRQIYEDELEKLRCEFAVTRGYAVSTPSLTLLSSPKPASRDGEKKKQEQARTDADAQRDNKDKSKAAPWTPKEIAVLIHAVKLYPGGSLQRWEKIAAYINAHAGEEDEDEKAKKRRFRKPDECIKMSKELDEGQAAAATMDRTKLQEIGSGIRKHEVEIKETPSMRYEAELEAERAAAAAKKDAGVAGKAAKPSEPAKTAEPAAKPVKEKAPTAPAPVPTPAAAVAAPAPAEAPKEKSAPAAAPAPAEKKAEAKSPVEAAANASETIWSPVQQAALEAALRQHPASMYKENPNERWDKIAPLVPGKTKKDIKARVKELAELVKQKKQAA